MSPELTYLHAIYGYILNMYEISKFTEGIFIHDIKLKCNVIIVDVGVKGSR